MFELPAAIVSGGTASRGEGISETVLACIRFKCSVEPGSDQLYSPILLI